jgi:hypothetical protein
MQNCRPYLWNQNLQSLPRQVQPSFFRVDVTQDQILYQQMVSISLGQFQPASIYVSVFVLRTATTKGISSRGVYWAVPNLFFPLPFVHLASGSETLRHSLLLPPITGLLALYHCNAPPLLPQTAAIAISH